MIFCDDLGFGELPVYRALYEDSDAVETAIGSFTPNLDELARRGVVCTRAYGNNTCAPARMSLLTGKWQTRKAQLGEHRLIGYQMRSRGMRTAHFGKYHHEVEKTITIPYRPDHLEFDEFFGLEAMTNYFRRAGEVIAERKNSPITYRVGERTIDYKFPAEGAYLTDTLTDLSVDFISRCVQDEKPLLLYLPFNAPHTPIQAKRDDLRTLFPELEGEGDVRQRIMAMMHAVDRGIGRLIQTLKERRQLDNTLILFTGDNNGEHDLSLNHPLHGYKHEPFDGGIRVPFVVWSKTLENSSSKPEYYDGLVSLCDILPTALRYVDPSADLAALQSDGTDIMPQLAGQKPPLEGRLYLNLRTLNHRSNTWDGGRDTEGETIGSCTALIADEWKLIRLTQDRRQKHDFSYALHHLPDMVGKPLPQNSLVEDYYSGTSDNQTQKNRLIRQLEELTDGERVSY
ncbi:sulfatase-like hydrolase/transferase [Botrimarina sp.]|uniref:sulfatase family protein n=1 Tax=Botrimarina sp. TaxID=2795802 RepID=UPI0032EE0594